MTLAALVAAAGSTQFLRGDLLVSVGSGPGFAGTGAPLSLRDCSSEGTMFEDLENIGDLRAVYKREMSAIFSERESVYKTPSKWKCGPGAEGDPPSPKLLALAARMPGWHYFVSAPAPFGGVVQMRSVTFDAFSAIVAEFQREYECKLTELQDRVLMEVARNQDVKKPALFCCMNVGCKEASGGASCLGPLTGDPFCDDQCDIGLNFTDLSTRLQPYHEELGVERQTSRTAVERALWTMRSFDINYAIARQLMCYERASLDLRSEMSLMSDAVSCMPKIWDPVVSIHDRK